MVQFKAWLKQQQIQRHGGLVFGDEDPGVVGVVVVVVVKLYV